MFPGVVNQIQQWYQQLVTYLTQHQFIARTGEALTFQQPVVVRFWMANVTIADVALTLVVLWVAYNIIFGFYQPLEILSRVVLAAIAVHASLQFIGFFIEINNALCATAVQVAGAPNLADIVNFLTGVRLDPNANGAVVVQVIIMDVMAVAILLQELARLGVLDLLIVIAPLAFLVPELARLWIAAFFAVLFLQFLQVAAIVLGAILIAGLGAGGTIVSTLAGLAILLLVLRIPTWLGLAVTQALGGIRSPFGYAVAAAREAARGMITLLRVMR
jgi:hypothetical protein